MQIINSHKFCEVRTLFMVAAPAVFWSMLTWLDPSELLTFFLFRGTFGKNVERRDSLSS